MIELPEAVTTAKDLKKVILGKTIIDVQGNFSDHKFTFYYKDPYQYKKMLTNKTVTNIIPRNYYIEIEIEDYKLIMRDGINIRYYTNYINPPKKSKLLLKFDDNSYINITVSMYAFISVFRKDEKIDNKYYAMELNGVSPLDKQYSFDYFKSLIDEETKKLSSKAFLATKQRILGIGNGTVQDILFYAKINPKTKIQDLSEDEILLLYKSTIDTIKNMIKEKGRDTEKNIYDQNGHYKTIMSKNNYKKGCPICKSKITKEQFLGGSIYYCPICQKKKTI